MVRTLQKIGANLGTRSSKSARYIDTGGPSGLHQIYQCGACIQSQRISYYSIVHAYLSFLSYWYKFAQQYKFLHASLIYSLKGEQEFMYHGDRTRDEIVKFALRLSGPPVQEITRTQSFDTIKRDRDLYFLYVGDRSGVLWVSFLFFFTNFILKVPLYLKYLYANIPYYILW